MVDSDVQTRVTALESLNNAVPAGLDCLVVIYSANKANSHKRYLLEKDSLSIGRGSDNEIVLDSDSVSRKHSKVVKRGTNWYIVDCSSTNGTYVNDAMVHEYPLRQGDQVKIGDTIFKYLTGADIESQYHETIYQMTIIDGLTTVYNKRYLLETLDREIPRAKRYKRPLSVIMFDIDFFKKINDTFGHLAGDHVLKEIAQLVKSRVRPDDTVARYGGEEFTAILPETTLEGAQKIAEDLRQRVQERVFNFEGEDIRVTISMGAAQLEGDENTSALLRLADEKLYRAKKTGRNQVCI